MSYRCGFWGNIGEIIRLICTTDSLAGFNNVDGNKTPLGDATTRCLYVQPHRAEVDVADQFRGPLVR